MQQTILRTLIFVLTNLETNEKKLLQLVLLGQPELSDLFAKPELRQLAQRVTARYHLPALSKIEVVDYIAHRLSVAGCRAPVFSSSAIRKIYHCSQGIPRVINLICDRSLLGAYATNSIQVNRRIVNGAIQEIYPPHQATSFWKPLALFLVMALFLLCCVLVFTDIDIQWPKNLLELGIKSADSFFKEIV